MKANANVAQRCGVPLTLTGQNGDLFYISLARRKASLGARWTSSSGREGEEIGEGCRLEPSATEAPEKEPSAGKSLQ